MKGRLEESLIPEPMTRGQDAGQNVLVVCPNAVFGIAVLVDEPPVQGAAPSALDHSNDATIFEELSALLRQSIHQILPRLEVSYLGVNASNGAPFDSVPKE